MSEKPVGTREWYDFIGELAETLPGIHLGGEAATRQLLEWCHLEATSEVLDVGCGPGLTACLIAQEYGSRVVGIDISEVMIAKAQEKARRLGVTGRVEFRVEDVFKMSFGDGSFDAIVLESVLTPLPGDKGQAMAEMVRVLRPAGRLAVNESTFDLSAPADLLAIVEQHPAMYGYFTPETLRTLFEQAGLQVVEMQVTKQSEAPSPLKAMGLGAVVSFMVRTYPKVLMKLLRDERFRRASSIDDQVTKRGKPYMGYTLILGQKAASLG
jgi:ubiquinone/menaquinone biosynthesis C-methylase UbiE